MYFIPSVFHHSCCVGVHIPQHTFFISSWPWCFLGAWLGSACGRERERKRENGREGGGEGEGETILFEYPLIFRILLLWNTLWSSKGNATYLRIHTALLRMFRALFQKCRALLQIYRSSLRFSQVILEVLTYIT